MRSMPTVSDAAARVGDPPARSRTARRCERCRDRGVSRRTIPRPGRRERPSGAAPPSRRGPSAGRCRRGRSPSVASADGGDGRPGQGFGRRPGSRPRPAIDLRRGRPSRQVQAQPRARAPRRSGRSKPRQSCDGLVGRHRRPGSLPAGGPTSAAETSSYWLKVASVGRGPTARTAASRLVGRTVTSSSVSKTTGCLARSRRRSAPGFPAGTVHRARARGEGQVGGRRGGRVPGDAEQVQERDVVLLRRLVQPVDHALGQPREQLDQRDARGRSDCGRSTAARTSGSARASRRPGPARSGRPGSGGTIRPAARFEGHRHAPGRTGRRGCARPAVARSR